MNETKATPIRNMGDWYEAISVLPSVNVQLAEPRDSSTRLLSTIERATMTTTTRDLDEMPLGRGVLYEGAFRLAHWQRRGILPYASGLYVAQHLQSVFWPERWNAIRYARRGLILLAAIDAADIGVTVYLGAEPLDADRLGPFRRMRLHERCEELSHSERHQHALR